MRIEGFRCKYDFVQFSPVDSLVFQFKACVFQTSIFSNDHLHSDILRPCFFTSTFFFDNNYLFEFVTIHTHWVSTVSCHFFNADTLPLCFYGEIVGHWQEEAKQKQTKDDEKKWKIIFCVCFSWFLQGKKKQVSPDIITRKMKWRSGRPDIVAASEVSWETWF